MHFSVVALVAGLACVCNLAYAARFGRTRDLFDLTKEAIAKDPKAKDIKKGQSPPELGALHQLGKNIADRTASPAGEHDHKGKAAEGGVNAEYYYYYSFPLPNSYLPAWGIIQYYSGNQCNGTLTYNYGYKNGACVSNGNGYSLRYVVSDNDCGSSVVIYYFGETCTYPYYYYQIGYLSTCVTQYGGAGSYMSSANLNCIFQEDVPVLMDSLTFSIRNDTQNCTSSVVAFDSSATSICLSDPTYDFSSQLFCNTATLTYVENDYYSSSTCGGSPDFSYTEATTCPAVGYPSLPASRRSLRGHKQGSHNKKAANNNDHQRKGEEVSDVDSAEKKKQDMKHRIMKDNLARTSAEQFNAKKAAATLEEQHKEQREHKNQAVAPVTTVTTAANNQVGTNNAVTPQTLTYCSPYSASNTNNAQRNYSSCLFYACPGIVVLSYCSTYGAVYSGDTYIRLFGSNGVQVAVNDDFCSLGSEISYTITGSVCDYFTVHQGCFSSGSCSGTLAISTDSSAIPSRYPSVVPSRNPARSMAPSPSATAAPTSVVQSCGTYTATNTLSATQNTIQCTFTACSMEKLTMATCGNCNSDTYLRLFNATGEQVAQNDDNCGSLCSKITYYTQESGCQTYSLHQGCYSSGACSGTVDVISSVVDSYYPNYYFEDNDYYSYYYDYYNYNYYYSGLYSVSQCTAQNYTLPVYVAPTQVPTFAPSGPTRSPTGVPVIPPTAAPTSPTVAPSTAQPSVSFSPSVVPTTATPTLANAVSFSVVQVIDGISYTTYASSASYYTTLIYSIAACMTGVTTSNIVGLQVSSYSASSVANAADAEVVSSSVNHKNKALTASDSIVATYSVFVTSGDVTYDTLTTQLEASISGTAFSGYLTSYSAVYGTPGFDDCTSSLSSTTQTSSTGSSSSSSSSSVSGGAVAGIVIGVLVAVCLFTGGAYYAGMMAGQAHSGDASETASTVSQQRPPGLNREESNQSNTSFYEAETPKAPPTMSTNPILAASMAAPAPKGKSAGDEEL